MPRLVPIAGWDAEEEPLALVKHPTGNEMAVVRPSLPPVVVDDGAQVVWEALTGALVAAWSPDGHRLAPWTLAAGTQHHRRFALGSLSALGGLRLRRSLDL